MAPTRSRGIISPIIGGTNYLSFPPLFVSNLSEEQASSPTDKCSSDMSKLDIQQVFEDVDRDGNGTIDFEELEYLLTEYFPGESSDPKVRMKLMEEIDTDGSGDIDAEEFYLWMVANAKSFSPGSFRFKLLKMRDERPDKVGKQDATIFTPLDIQAVQELSSDLATKQLIKKPRVLFFHGEYTNEKIGSNLLKMTGYGTLFDFVIPPAMYEGYACPEELQDSLGLGPLIKKGLYPLDGCYNKWGGRFELMEEDPSTFKEDEKVAFQTDLKKYVTELDERYGPFDGLMGFCEGGAALNTILGMKELGELNGALDSAKFFAHLAPWTTPLGDDYALSTPKTIPTLTALGKGDFDLFQNANATYEQGFTGYYDHYSHDGKHNYPFVTDDLRHKLLSLVDKSTDGFVAEDWQLVCDAKDTDLLDASLNDEQKASCLDIIVDIACKDTDQFTLKSTLFDELELDSLDVTEFFFRVKEAYKGDDDDYDTNKNEMRIFANRDGATVQHLLDETALIISG